MSKEISVSLPADTRHGYLSVDPVVFVNNAGNPLDPQPDPASVSVTVVGDGVIGEAKLMDDRRIFFNPLDAALPGAAADIVISAVETGTDDDAVVHYTVSPDRIAGADLSGLAFAEVPDPTP